MFMIGSRKIMPKAVIKVPMPSAEKKLLESAFPAVSLSFAPRERERILPDPMPSVKPMAWIKAIREKTTPTAADWLFPSWDTK